MTDGEFAASCQMMKPAEIAAVPRIPNQVGQPRVDPLPGSSAGHWLGTLCSRFTARTASSGAAMSSSGTGSNTPPRSSGSPGTSQATTAIAGMTVSLARLRPTISPRRSARSRRTARSAADSGLAWTIANGIDSLGTRSRGTRTVRIRGDPPPGLAVPGFPGGAVSAGGAPGAPGAPQSSASVLGPVARQGNA